MASLDPAIEEDRARLEEALIARAGGSVRVRADKRIANHLIIHLYRRIKIEEGIRLAELVLGNRNAYLFTIK